MKSRGSSENKATASRAEAEMRRMRDDLGRRIHDQAFAHDLSRIPDAEWAETGDHFVRPYGQGSSSSSSSSAAAVVPNVEPLRLYFKGLVVREETVRGKRETISAGLGIAICDMRDDRVLEMRKPLVCGGGGGDMSPEVVEVKALILGLEAAVSLGIKRLTVFCGDSSLHQYVSHFLFITVVIVLNTVRAANKSQLLTAVKFFDCLACLQNLVVKNRAQTTQY